MIFESIGARGIDYQPCRYGTSKLVFRGPSKNLNQPYIGFVGGIETYGKFISIPFPDQLEQKTGVPAVNFGLPNAGIDAYACDPMIAEVLDGATANVVQILGAANMTNRFYSVHPRRNDRFIAATPILQNIYPEVDFAEFHFTRHMLNRLIAISPERFDLIRAELQEAWLARMHLLLGQIRGKTLLLWFAKDAPPEDEKPSAEMGLGPDPIFITRQMLDKVVKNTEGLIEVVVSATARQSGTRGMVFNQLERLAANEMLGPDAHQEAADALLPALKALI